MFRICPAEQKKDVETDELLSLQIYRRTGVEDDNLLNPNLKS